MTDERSHDPAAPEPADQDRIDEATEIAREALPSEEPGDEDAGGGTTRSADDDPFAA